MTQGNIEPLVLHLDGYSYSTQPPWWRNYVDSIYDGELSFLENRSKLEQDLKRWGCQMEKVDHKLTRLMFEDQQLMVEWMLTYG